MSQLSLLIWLGLVTMIWSGSVGASAYNVFSNILICISPYTTSPMIGVENKVATCKDILLSNFVLIVQGRHLRGLGGRFPPRKKKKENKKER